MDENVQQRLKNFLPQNRTKTGQNRTRQIQWGYGIHRPLFKSQSGFRLLLFKPWSQYRTILFDIQTISTVGPTVGPKTRLFLSPVKV